MTSNHNANQPAPSLAQKNTNDDDLSQIHIPMHQDDVRTENKPTKTLETRSFEPTAVAGVTPPEGFQAAQTQTRHPQQSRVSQSFWRWLLWVLFALFLLLGAVALYLFYGVDYDRYKPQIEQQMAQITQGDVKIQGHILFDWRRMGVGLLDVSIDQPQHPALSAIERLDIKAFWLDWNIASLLTFTPRIQHIEIQQPTLRVQNVLGMPAWLKEEKQWWQWLPVNQTVSSKTNRQTTWQQIAQTHLPERLSIENATIYQAQDKDPTWQQLSIWVHPFKWQDWSDVQWEGIWQKMSDQGSPLAQRKTRHRINPHGSFHLWLGDDRVQFKQWHMNAQWINPKQEKLPITLQAFGEPATWHLGQIDVPDLEVMVGNARLSLSLQGQKQSGHGNDWQWQGTVDTNRMALAPLFVQANVERPNFVQGERLNTFQWQADWRMDGEQLHVNVAKFNVDESTVSGTITYQPNITNETKWQIHLAVDHFNQASYLVYSDQGNGSTYFPFAVPIRAFREANVSGQVTFETLHWNDWQWQQIALPLSIQNGQLQLHDFSARLPSSKATPAMTTDANTMGQLQGQLQLDVNGDTPAYQWQMNFEHLPLALASDATWLGGPINGQFKGTTQGSNAQAIAANMNASLNIAIQPLAIELRGHNAMLVSYAQQSTQESLVLQSTITQGIAVLDQLAIEDEFIHIQGQGDINLVQQTLNITLTTNAEAAQRPFKVFGDWRKPTVFAP